MSSEPQHELDQLASRERERSLLRDVFDQLRESRKWWLMPIIIVLCLIGALAVLGGGAAAPFIYTLF